MDIKRLQKLGLSRNEAKVYLALLESGESLAGRLSKKTQINRTTTYDALERLLEKGLISYSLQAGRKVFKPAAPQKIMENIQEQEKEAQEIIPQLNQLYAAKEQPQESRIHTGRKGIRSILQDILKCREYVAFGSSGKFLEIMKHDFIAFQKRKRELKIKSKVILNESSRKSESVQAAFTSFRFIPDTYTAPTTTFIYGDSIAIIVWAQIPIATVIKSKDAAKSYHSYFELLWKRAKK